MSQRGLARVCGVSHTAIQKLELALATKTPPKTSKALPTKGLKLATKTSSEDMKSTASKGSSGSLSFFSIFLM